MSMPDDDDIPQDDLEDLIDLEYEAEMDLMRELEQVNKSKLFFCFTCPLTLFIVNIDLKIFK
jgi:hypothetical protein